MINKRRKSIRWFSSETRKPFSDFYTDMFLEDLRVSFMPIAGIARRRSFSVKLVPENIELEALLIAGLVPHQHEDSLAGAVSELLSLVASEVCAMDRAIYEIVFSEDDKAKQIAGFELDYVDPTSVRVKRGQISQRLPRKFAEEHNYPENISFEKSDLVIFEPPIGMRASITTARRVLSRLSELSLSPFVNEAVRMKVPYEYEVHRTAMEIAFASAMKNIGWTAHSLFREGKLSYYSAYMQLVFERFKLQLRDALIAKLNEALSTIGQLMNFSSKIEITGLPTSEEIDQAMAELECGKRAFTAIMEPFLRY